MNVGAAARETVLAQVDALAAAGDLDGACAQIESWLDRQPGDVPARCGLGQLLLRQRRPDDALAQFYRAYGDEPEYPGLARELGRLLMFFGEFEVAGRVLYRAWSARAPGVDSELQELLRRQDRYPDALAVAEQAARHAPGRDTRLNLGRMLYWNQHLEQAVEVFSELGAAHPDLAAQMEVLQGTVRFEQHRFDEAQALYAQVRARDPGNPFLPKMEKDLRLMRYLVGREFGEDRDGRVAPSIAAVRDTMNRCGVAPMAAAPAVVLYHVDIAGEHPHGGGRQHEVIAADDLLRAAIRACRAWMPGAAITLFADANTQIAPDVEPDRLVRLPVVTAQIMFQRMRTMCAFVHSDLFDRHTVFLDTDAIVNGDLAPVFDGSFAVGLSSRPYDPLMPLNEGVIFADHGAGDEVRAFFVRCLAAYLELADDETVARRYKAPVKHWRGGQLSLAAATGWPRFESTPCMLEAAGARVRVFPVNTHNYPYAEHELFGAACTRRMAWDRLIVHFKGGKPKLELVPFLAERMDWLHPSQGSAGSALEHAAALRERGRPWAALRALRAAGEEADEERAALLRVLGRSDEASEVLEAVAARADAAGSAHADLALLQLRRGELAHGWDEYRWGLPAGQRMAEPVPLAAVHDGPLNGEAVLVCGEQGIGDEIMFASCLPDLQALAPGSTVHCNGRLQPLFARSFPRLEFRGFDGRWTAQELAKLGRPLPIGDLPRYFRRDWAAFGDGGPFLAADPARVADWRRRLAALGPGLRAGFSWRGGQNVRRHLKRSPPLAAWRDLLATPGIQWISVQYGNVSDDLAVLGQAGARVHVLEGIDPLRDMDEFAALLAALDCVVSIDNSTVHLAGALGVPTSVALWALPDWRWFLGRTDSPWYRSVRLYRQRDAGDWGGVLAAMQKDLAVRAGGAMSRSVEG